MPAGLAAVLGSFGAAALLLVFLWGATGWACDVGAALHVALPFDSGHAHNSEQHAGLEGSLAQGLCSVEVDCFAIGKDCLVGHNQGVLQADQTLQALYLDPLLQRVRANGGLVYPQSRYLGVCTVLTLMVDVKDTPRQSPERSFDIIHSILQTYAEKEPGFLARWDGAQNQPSGRGAVSVQISGARPAAQHMLSQFQRRYAILDGREGDLGAGLPVSLVPVISKAWHGGSDAVVRGMDQLHPQPKELAAAQRLIQRAHAQGRRVRFWGTLDTPQQWQMMFDLGADIISTDDVSGLRAFVTSRAAAAAPRQQLLRWRLRSPLGSADVVVRRLFGRRGLP